MNLKIHCRVNNKKLCKFMLPNGNKLHIKMVNNYTLDIKQFFLIFLSLQIILKSIENCINSMYLSSPKCFGILIAVKFESFYMMLKEVLYIQNQFNRETKEVKNAF
jgi:hypothetical protein